MKFFLLSGLLLWPLLPGVREGNHFARRPMETRDPSVPTPRNPFLLQACHFAQRVDFEVSIILPVLPDQAMNLDGSALAEHRDIGEPVRSHSVLIFVVKTMQEPVSGAKYDISFFPTMTIEKVPQAEQHGPIVQHHEGTKQSELRSEKA